MDPDAFLAMLKYLYCDEIDLNNDNVLATLYAAKKYLVPALGKINALKDMTSLLNLSRVNWFLKLYSCKVGPGKNT